jgi:hypothetical protein
MTALRFAIKEGRYELAAHIIVLAAARALRNGNGAHGSKKAKKLLLRCPR